MAIERNATGHKPAQNLLKVSTNRCSASKKPPKKRRTGALCRHFEAVFRAAMRHSVRL